MIKIDIDTKHVEDLSDLEELKCSSCELTIMGTPDELRHELSTLLETIEKRPSLYHIWLDVLSDCAAKRCDEI